MTNEDICWRGVPLTEIYGAQNSFSAPEFPLITPSYNHTVLYHISNSGNILDDRPPVPQIGQEKWDHNYVRLPCSKQSLYPFEDRSTGEVVLKKRWKIIEEALNKPIANSHELADAILSYNTKFRTFWKFTALHKLFEEYLEEEEVKYFFEITLPAIKKLALDLPNLIQAPIPLLKQHRNQSVSLSQQQISCLLANAFFCTFPRRNSYKSESEYASYPYINLNQLFNSKGSHNVIEKLKCICHYFRRVCTKVPTGVVTFSRRSVLPQKCPNWMTSDRLISSLPLHVDAKTTIEDAHGLIQVDFANKFLGGGVLRHGCVQEEIRFVICPELMISMLLAEMLRPNEAILMIGIERYSEYSGYSESFEWSGNYQDTIPYDSSRRKRCAVLAIDAILYSNTTHQYMQEMFTRELNKAWVGFSFYTEYQATNLQYPGVATGNWGCGAFQGSPHLKSLLQLMACVEARRPMAYFTFNDPNLRDEIINVYNMLARFNVTVGQLYSYLIRFSRENVRKVPLYSFLYQMLLDEQKKVSAEKNADNEMDTTTLPNNLQNSPDLFSQELDTTVINIDNKYCHISAKETLVGDNTCNANIDDLNGDVDSEHERRSKRLKCENISKLETKENYISQLFQEMDKLDNASRGLIDLNKVSDKVNKEAEGKSNDSNIAIESKMEISENEIETKENEVSNTSTSRLFSEMEKFDNENGTLNLSSTQAPSPLKVIVSDVSKSLRDEKISVEISEESKRKIAKKITDYFSKKT